MDKTITDHEIIAMLEWYKSSGVDEAILNEPGDWFAWEERAPQSQATARSQSQSSPRPPLPKTSERETSRSKGPATPARPAPAPSASTDEVILKARESAASAQSIDDLENTLQSFEGCGLSRTATNLCFYRGAIDADIMFIGDAPGRDEDIEGKPFVGMAGGLLDKMLKSIDLEDTGVHLTNIIYWRPPGNRAPTELESQICQPFIERQLELVAPKMVIFLGGAPAKQLLGTTEGIMRSRGKWHDLKYGDQTVSAMATLHPAYLLRTPAAKRLAWRDLLEIRAKLDE